MVHTQSTDPSILPNVDPTQTECPMLKAPKVEYWSSAVSAKGRCCASHVGKVACTAEGQLTLASAAWDLTWPRPGIEDSAWYIYCYV